MQHITQQILDQMKNKVLENRPQLKTILENSGNLSYYDYVKRKNRVNTNKTYRERKVEFSDVIKQEVARLLGTVTAESVEKQIKKNDSFSTTEHTSPVSTTNVLNSALHLSLPFFNNTDSRFQNILVLSCSGISFNNASSFSRGLFFHTFSSPEAKQIDLTFFGRSVDPQTVMYAPPYTHASVEEMQNKLIQLIRENSLDKTYEEKLERLLNEVYLSPHAMTSGDYVDQITITNYYLWKTIFAEQNQTPNYIMLSQEKILLNLLLKYHIDEKTFIHNFIFNRSYHELIEKYFNGITGAFNLEEQTGTVLFWGYSKHTGTRIQLFRMGNKLISKDGSFELTLEPQNVRQAIENKEIFPGLLLTFITLAFYYGLYLGGWTSQTSYLTQMKKAYLKMLHDLHEIDEAANVEECITDDLVIPRPHLAFLDFDGQRIDASGLDLYLYQNPTKWPEIINATKTISFSDFMTVLLPTLYNQFCPDDQKDGTILQISRQDIEKFTSFDKKLPLIGIIS